MTLLFRDTNYRADSPISCFSRTILPPFLHMHREWSRNMVHKVVSWWKVFFFIFCPLVCPQIHNLFLQKTTESQVSHSTVHSQRTFSEDGNLVGCKHRPERSHSQQWRLKCMSPQTLQDPLWGCACVRFASTMQAKTLFLRNSCMLLLMHTKCD